MKRRFAFPTPSLTLPNEGSRHQSPTTLLIDSHYATLLLPHRWTWDRFIRLCEFAQWTPYELASIVMLPHRYVDQYREGGRLPRPIAMQTGLFLSLVEHRLMGHLAYDTISDPFPTLANLAPK